MRAGRGSGVGAGGAKGGKKRRGSAPGGGADPFANRGFYYWFDLLDAEHRAKLQAFRSRLEAASVLAKPMDSDVTLARFLRARGWDEDKAYAMYDKCMKWRADFGTEDLQDGYKDFSEKNDVITHYPQYYHKTDRIGRPIYIEELGNLQTSKLREFTTEERMLRFHVAEWELMNKSRFPAASVAAGRQVFTSYTLLDLKGLSMRQFDKFARSFVSKAIAIDQDNYPEHLGSMFIINAPWYFSTIWKVVKGFMDGNTAEKIQILGTDWKDTVQKYVDMENVPSRLGGLCTCSGRGGCHLSDPGPWNPLDIARDYTRTEKDIFGQKTEVTYFDATELAVGA